MSVGRRSAGKVKKSGEHRKEVEVLLVHDDDDSILSASLALPTSNNTDFETDLTDSPLSILLSRVAFCKTFSFSSFFFYYIFLHSSVFFLWIALAFNMI